MRKVALDLYTQPCEMEQKLDRAKALDAELANWLAQAPSHLRSENLGGADLGLKPRRLASFVKKQSVVLRLRKSPCLSDIVSLTQAPGYLNLRMVIHAVFMTDAQAARSEEATCLRECQSRCIQSAEDAIDLMYSTFRTDDYFQTWYDLPSSTR